MKGAEGRARLYRRIGLLGLAVMLGVPLAASALTGAGGDSPLVIVPLTVGGLVACAAALMYPERGGFAGGRTAPPFVQVAVLLGAVTTAGLVVLFLVEALGG